MITERIAYLAGVDEVGRGALFGPVVAAAVVISPLALPQLTQMGVKDSKLLSAQRRYVLAQQIKTVALDWHIGSASAQEIDRLNILQASLLAMRRAVTPLQPQPEHCLVDGKFIISELSIEQTSMIKGDKISPIIAAASIVAKVWRDELIERLALSYPEYDLAANKGYGTKRHRLALREYGASPQHRMSFRPCRVNVSQESG